MGSYRGVRNRHSTSPTSHSLGPNKNVSRERNGLKEDEPQTNSRRRLRKSGSTSTTAPRVSLLYHLMTLLIIAAGMSMFAMSRRLKIADSSISRLWDRAREHTIISYVDAFTNKQQSSRTILVLVPQPSNGLTFRRLNYYHSIPDENGVNYTDPDDGRAIPILPDEYDRPCYPIGEWQNLHYPTCNTIHAIQMDATGPRSLHLVHCGGMRCVYRIPGTALEPDYVLKILKLERTNETVMYRFARKDAVAMERLSSSPYALDMYVMCSLSKVLEYSSGGNIHDLMKRTRVAEKVGGGNDLRVQVGDELAGYVSASETTSDKITTSDMLKEEDEDEIEMDETVNNTTEEEFVIVEDEHRHSSPVQYQRHQTTTPLTKLKIAFQVATAVADMHAIEAHPDGLPAMVSNDLCCHQFVLVNGVYKLSDFDYTTLITVRSVEPKSQSMNATRRNSDPSLRGTGPTTLSHPKEETCQTTPFKGWGAFKILPPEHLPYLDSMATHRRIYRDKLDIWQIGNIMYLILTNSYVWEGIDSAPAMLATYHGAHPPFPDDLWEGESAESKEYVAIESMKEAILMAWTHDLLERPSARDISNHLHAALQQVVKSSTGDDNTSRPVAGIRKEVVRVDGVPPLPPNHRFTESDFYKQQKSL